MPDDSIERHFKTEGTVAINFVGLRRSSFETTKLSFSKGFDRLYIFDFDVMTQGKLRHGANAWGYRLGSVIT